ncbi:uroporphyrinogen-III synthase [Sediminibacillus dalangtanensis]|uniref:Uroporphyrinogen-III synthase n=1 Tax=Sediminibacillus dalangtanensis TaxID=2729421 RepID=A0ABX7VTX9_9BACI|nr:uroporphyrinogen-III synthase [Sediminibacillus dalangtanensis]QTM99983.1 uroporphyrinogen-III synthase [Sediminibacillus dalangtanensis]
MGKPLAGKRVLITRSEQQAEDFASKLEEAEAVPVIVPLLRLQKREAQSNKQILSKLHEFTWVFFTSANGVKFFFEQLRDCGLDSGQLENSRVAAVGRKTRQALHKQGLSVDFTPEKYSGKRMATEFMKKYPDPGPVLLVCGGLARQDIPLQLERQKVYFQKAVVYDTLINTVARDDLLSFIREGKLDVYTFTSPSTVKAFMKLTSDEPELQQKVVSEALTVCIGPTTKEAAGKQGFTNILVPKDYTLEGMIKQLARYYDTERN